MKKSNTSAAGSHANENSSETYKSANSKGSKQEANLRKNSFIYFQIGLIGAMFLVYFGLETAFDKFQPQEVVQAGEIVETIEMYPELKDFEVEKTEAKPELVHKVVAPQTLQVVPDEFKVPDSKEFKSEPVAQPNLKPSDIIVVKPIVEEVFTFVTLEDVPVFPGCESVAKSERKTCFEESMQKHILKNFRYPEVAVETHTQGKVYVMFTIGKDGNIEDVRLKGPAKILEKEAARIIDKLPQMKPGMQRLQPVKVSFSIPINFQLQ
ncbi:TonB family protein [Cellulophaga algicola DSM 14237]|uniref:TonB family protein n=1 Tax=Cellulophaga algicola (strain DSM 14237 / IC166 / ACAM 630) TaxID=688270 RepID=E6X4Q0_CELAD|nr:energy transducer TonB [Cellulophaga algicola]ADV49375.1 TonB family protein [Cellulophaga algicola DSM 14237]